jgi:hypothetical protein
MGFAKALYQSYALLQNVALANLHATDFHIV